MVKDPVAVRYAEALFELGKREGRLEALTEELEALAKLIGEHDQLRELLLNPDVDVPDKLRVIGRLLGDASKDLQAFLQVVLQSERAPYIVQMADALRQLVDREQRVLRVVVRTVHPLAAPLRERLVGWLSKREHSTVVLVEELDATLLGGIQVTLDHRTYDGSLRTQLDRLRHRMKSVRVH
jgi:F-type H+-transporting ATPase subunit delta